jgi:uncharacterized protein (TIGR03435 family)
MVCRPYEIVGGPGWTESDTFQIEARFEGDDVPARMVPMLRQVLADRFQLRVHREMRQMAVFALKVSKGGPKLKPSPPANDPASAEPRMRIFPGRLIASKQTTSSFAGFLTRSLGRRVLDQTMLTGTYDFTLQWTPDELQRAPLRPDGPAPDPNGPSIFTALQEQLGLELESGRGPVEVLVVDDASRPTPD